MAAAVPGVTTAFTLNAAAPTQLSNSNNGRTYLFVANLDLVQTVYVAFGTNNGATTTSIPVGPRKYLELTVGKGIMQGDVSAIAGAGTPNVTYTEA